MGTTDIAILIIFVIGLVVFAYCKGYLDGKVTGFRLGKKYMYDEVIKLLEEMKGRYNEK